MCQLWNNSFPMALIREGLFSPFSNRKKRIGCSSTLAPTSRNYLVSEKGFFVFNFHLTFAFAIDHFPFRLFRISPNSRNYLVSLTGVRERLFVFNYKKSKISKKVNQVKKLKVLLSVGNYLVMDFKAKKTFVHKCFNVLTIYNLLTKMKCNFNMGPSRTYVKSKI